MRKNNHQVNEFRSIVDEEKEGLDLLGDMLRMPLTVFRFVQEFALAVQRKQGKQAQTA